MVKKINFPMANGVNERSFLKMPVVLLFGSQLVAGVLIFLVIMPVIQKFTNNMPTLPLLLAIQGGVAVFIGLLFGLHKWWGGVQIILPFAAFYSQYLQAPAWLWLLLFALVFLVYKNSVRSGVPLYLSNTTTWRTLVDLLPVKKGIKIIDLGGGLGGTGLFMGKNRPDAEILSIESAPIPAAISKIRRTLSGLKNVEMRYGDFWDIDLSAYKVVYAFLSPVPMERLYKKVKAELKPGSLFISNSFDVPNVQADEILELPDGRKTKLHLWRF